MSLPMTLKIRWVTCTKYESWPVSLYRHLISRDADVLTTLCGSTANMPDVWKSNYKKEKCPVCVNKVKEES